MQTEKPPSRTWRWWPTARWLLVVAVVVAVIYVARFRPLPVVGHEVTKGTLVSEIMGTGTLEARVKTTISPRLQERLAEVLVDQDDAVKAGQLLARLDEGATIAVASDAGTPLLSDPGYVLTRAAIAAGHRVEAIPGPAAPLVALLVSGLPPYPFTFAGFAPPKSGKRRKLYARLGALGHTVVLFESPHRLLASLDDAIAELGARPAAIARELTKAHEEVLRGTLPELRTKLGERDKLLGEFVLVIGGEGEPAADGEGSGD